MKLNQKPGLPLLLQIIAPGKDDRMETTITDCLGQTVKVGDNILLAELTGASKVSLVKGYIHNIELFTKSGMTRKTPKVIMMTDGGTAHAFEKTDKMVKINEYIH